MLPSGRIDTPSLLIFDLDGTLYDTRSSFLPTMRAIYAEFGLPYPSDEVILSLVGETFPVFLDWLLARGFPASRAALGERIAHVELASIRTRGRLFPDVAETLRQLRASGHILTLCTNGDRRYAETVLSTCGVLDLFAQLCTDEIEGQTKADRARALRSGVPHRRAFLIGDRSHDLEAGRAAGCTVVGASYGFGAADELETADVHIERFRDLVALVEGRTDRRSPRPESSSA